MRKKQILICDDDPSQYGVLKKICERNGYEVHRSHDWKTVVEDIKKHDVIHLLILDLGFQRDIFEGHKCVPKVASEFPDLKIIIFSRLLIDRDRKDDAMQIFNELKKYSNVVAFLSRKDRAEKIEEKVNEVLQTCSWLQGGEVWLLHISDTQFGGDGMLGDPESVAENILNATKLFCKTHPDDDEGGPRRFPGIIIISGDLVQHGRPDEYEMATKFLKTLNSATRRERADFKGLIEDSRIIITPGNHDINWDILRAINIHCIEKKDASGSTKLEFHYKDGKQNYRKELEFIRQYSWAPFCSIPIGLPKGNINWPWETGFHVMDLSQELGMVFVSVNSSRWGVNHLEQNAEVSRSVWRTIKKVLENIDSKRKSARILVIHHTLDLQSEPENLLRLPDTDDEFKQMVEILSEQCGFALVLTGHIHELIANDVNTGTKSRTLIHIGAGTARSNDRLQYNNPQFNIVKICEWSPDTNKFEKLIIYPFSWDGNRFFQLAAFERGTQTFDTFELKY